MIALLTNMRNGVSSSIKRAHLIQPHKTETTCVVLSWLMLLKPSCILKVHYCHVQTISSLKSILFYVMNETRGTVNLSRSGCRYGLMHPLENIFFKISSHAYNALRFWYTWTYAFFANSEPFLFVDGNSWKSG